MTVPQRLKHRLHIRLGDNLIEWHMLHIPDNPLHHIGALGTLYHQRQLHRGLTQFYRGSGVLV